MTVHLLKPHFFVCPGWPTALLWDGLLQEILRRAGGVNCMVHAWVPHCSAEGKLPPSS